MNWVICHVGYKMYAPATPILGMYWECIINRWHRHTKNDDGGRKDVKRFQGWLSLQ